MNAKYLSIGIVTTLTLIILAGFNLGPKRHPMSQTSRQQALSIQNPSKSQDGASSNADGSLVMRQLTTQQAAKLSTRIVLVKCRNVEIREIPRAGIYTISEFEVLQTIKGTLNSSHFTLSLIGGRIGDRQTTGPFDGFEFTAGEKYILFLGPDAKDGEPTINPYHRFRVRKNPLDNSEVVTPVPADLPLYHAKDSQLYSSSPTLLPLEDFLFSLGKLN